jgi:hypothetical protein
VDLPRRIRVGASVALAGALGFLASPLAADASTAPACAPPRLNVSAALAGGAVTVSPEPDSADASYRTQISLVGVPVSNIARISVVGSRSGRHTGTLAPYSQGDGGSFIPAKPFAEGEVVTVRGALRRASGAQQAFAWHFTTATPDRVSRSLETPPAPPPPAKPSDYQHFLSRPDLVPPRVTVTVNTGAQAPGDLLLAPYAGPGQYGPMILDGAGGLIWFKRLPAHARAADLRAQVYEGHPVLSWWEEPLGTGSNRSGVVIVDNSYRQIATIRAGNGLDADLHAFEITPRGTALLTVYDAIRCNLSAHRGPADGAVADTLFQEIDMRTGLVRFEWHALDHVPLGDSYMRVSPGSARSPWDFFHINAVSLHGKAILVDARNTWAAYEVDSRTAQVVWRLGGKRSSFTMGPGATPAWQHDAREGPEGTITFFDNGFAPQIHPQSRAIVVQLNLARKTASLVSSFTHAGPLLSASQGNFQPLADGNWTVGWGEEPYMSEFSAAGQLLFDAHLPRAYQSYTVLTAAWSATPQEPPRVAVSPGAQGGIVVYASWNGATGVTQWRLLGGGSPQSLAPIATAPRSGFETGIATQAVPAYVAVQALGEQGEVLATSAVIPG